MIAKLLSRIKTGSGLVLNDILATDTARDLWHSAGAPDPSKAVVSNASADGASGMAGSVHLFDADLHFRVAYCDANSETDLTLTFEFSPGWRFKDSFPGVCDDRLQTVPFANAKLLFVSHNKPTDADAPDALDAPGFHFNGRTQGLGYFSLAAELGFADDNLLFQGPIASIEPFVIDASAQFPDFNFDKISCTGNQFAIRTEPLPSDDETPPAKPQSNKPKTAKPDAPRQPSHALVTSNIALHGDFQLSSSIQMGLSLTLPTENNQISVDGAFEQPLTIAALDDLFNINGNSGIKVQDSLLAFLPDKITETLTNNIGCNAFGFTLDLDSSPNAPSFSKRILEIYFSIALSKPVSLFEDLIPGISFVLEEFEVRWVVGSPFSPKERDIDYFISGQGHLNNWKFDFTIQESEGLFIGLDLEIEAGSGLDSIPSNIFPKGLGPSVPSTLPLGGVGLASWPSKGIYSLYGILSNWKVSDGVTLRSVGFMVDVRAGSVSDAQLAATIDIASTEIDLLAMVDVSKRSLAFSGSVRSADGIPIGHLLSDLAGKFGVTADFPQALADLVIKSLEVSFNTGSKAFKAACDMEFPINDKPAELELIVDIGGQDEGAAKEFSGSLTLGGQVFKLLLDVDADGKRLAASWKAEGDSYLKLEDLIAEFGLPAPDIPPQLDPSLRAATFKYNATGPSLLLEADSVNFGRAVFVANKDPVAKKWKFFFGLAVDRELNLSNLPLLDQVLPADETLSVKKLKVLAASSALDASQAPGRDEIDRLNKLIDANYPQVPAQGMPSMFALSAEFDFGGYVIPLSIGGGATPAGTDKQPATPGGDKQLLPPSGKQLPAPPKAAVGKSSGAKGKAVPSPARAADGATWFDVQKSFGPVNFQKVGVKYKDGVLWVLLDASLGAAGLDISVAGLSVGTPVSDFSPRFNIEGLGLDFKNAVITIQGGFEKMPVKPPVTLEFAGSATLQLKVFGASAIGSYAQFDGKTSMFVFAAVKGEFGGPGCFFVTGFCGGFGYNSKLRIPEQDEVFKFPFVKATLNSNAFGENPTPTDVLESIMGGDKPWIAPSAGDIWVTAGIQFTTYEVVNSTALITAEFGHEFVLALIGVSSARFPMVGSQVYAYVELQIEALFAPDRGLISFTASLSPNSFLLDPNCHLTGGFAMVFWFGSNPHAGDFVLTLGGYSPYFKAPAHYPQEARVGFNWALDSTISISGGVYFALTPTAVMAGGSLDARYQDGALKAWFNAHADIIIWYDPFHFIADIGIDVGASYKLKILFVSTTVTVELGANLTLWGPSTGGTATVHWFVISFTVDFGASRSSIPSVQDWTQFSKVLPAPGNLVKLQPLTGLAPPPGQATAADQTAASEAAADQTAAPPPWTVRSAAFRFTTESAIPITQLYLGDSKTPLKTGDAVNIKPMARTGLVVRQTISIVNHETGDDVLDNNWRIDFTTRNVPDALWGVGSNTALSDDRLIADQLSGFDIAPPPPTLGPGAGVMNSQDLAYDPLPPGVNPLKLGTPPTGPIPQRSAESLAEIKQIMRPATKARRDGLFDILTALGMTELTNGDLTAMAADADFLFVDQPLLTAA